MVPCVVRYSNLLYDLEFIVSYTAFIINWLFSILLHCEASDPLKLNRILFLIMKFACLCGDIIEKHRKKMELADLTLCLPVSSADNLGKQFGPRSGPPDQGPNCLTF